MRLPELEEVIKCPSCKSQCAFTRPKDSGRIKWNHVRPHVSHVIDVRYCRSCGEPMVQHSWHGHKGETNPQEIIIYPVATNRDPAPKEVKKANLGLAKDYDEAVACEPHSLQAAAMLLGRCASLVLIEKCAADKSKTLGVQYRAAVAAEKLPNSLTKQFDGLLDNRNRSAHVWLTDDGDHLEVEACDIDWCFDIVGLLFEHFYVNPAQLAERLKHLDKVRAQKDSAKT